jgi:hypothetical protein
MKFEIYLRFNALVNSRCFGSGLPSSSLVPMADNFNHANKHCAWGLINKPLHLKGDPGSKYFLQGRFMDDVSAIYKNCKDTEKLLEKLTLFDKQNMQNNIEGWFNKPSFAKHHFEHSIEGFK